MSVVARSDVFTYTRRTVYAHPVLLNAFAMELSFTALLSEYLVTILNRGIAQCPFWSTFCQVYLWMQGPTPDRCRLSLHAMPTPGLS